MRERYYVPWDDETSETTYEAVAYVAAEVGRHCAYFTADEVLESLLRLIGWLCRTGGITK